MQCNENLSYYFPACFNWHDILLKCLITLYICFSAACIKVIPHLHRNANNNQSSSHFKQFYDVLVVFHFIKFKEAPSNEVVTPILFDTYWHRVILRDNASVHIRWRPRTEKQETLAVMIAIPYIASEILSNSSVVWSLYVATSSQTRLEQAQHSAFIYRKVLCLTNDYVSQIGSFI